MPTTTARTPRPSANAAPMMNVARIWAAASGFRPIALVESPVRMPMPMPGPITPRAARPAPRFSICGGSSCRPGGSPGHVGLVGGSVVEALAAGELGGDVAFGDVLADVAVALGVLFVVTLDRDQREHQREDREDQRLHEVEQDLEAEHQHRENHERQAGDDAKGDLARVDVAEESHRQRHGLHELEQELEKPDEQRDDARSDAVAEPAEVEELAEIAADAEAPDALDVEQHEADEGQADRHVHVAGRRTEPFDLPHGWDQTAPVAQEDVDEEGGEDGAVAAGGRTTERRREVREALVDVLKRVLP